MRLQPNDERRREPLRLQANDERRRKPLRLQSSEERRREARSREEPLRLQQRDERRREPLGLQSNNDRREPVRLWSNDDRRRETLRLQPREERRRDARSREEPSRLQSDAIPQYSGARRVRRSPIRTGADGGHSWRVEHAREENSDSKREDSHQSFRHSRSNGSSMHLASTGRHVGTLGSQVHNNPEIEQNTRKKPVLDEREMEIAPRELQNRKRRASPDEQRIDLTQKRVHVEERRENVLHKSNESKERKRESSNDDGRSHHHATKTTIQQHDVTNTSEQEPPELKHRKESQDHTRFCLVDVFVVFNTLLLFLLKGIFRTSKI